MTCAVSAGKKTPYCMHVMIVLVHAAKLRILIASVLLIVQN